MIRTLIIISSLLGIAFCASVADQDDEHYTFDVEDFVQKVSTELRGFGHPDTTVYLNPKVYIYRYDEEIYRYLNANFSILYVYTDELEYIPKDTFGDQLGKYKQIKYWTQNCIYLDTISNIDALLDDRVKLATLDERDALQIPDNRYYSVTPPIFYADSLMKFYISNIIGNNSTATSYLYVNRDGNYTLKSSRFMDEESFWGWPDHLGRTDLDSLETVLKARRKGID